MTLNPFFLQGSPGEQFLVQDLINEHLKMFGVEVYYLPRKIFKTDDIIREIQSSKFDDVFLIEAYINNFDGYAPDSDIMTKFGLRLKNEISLTISRERYEEFIAPFLEGISSGIREGLITEYDFADLITRPKEGDLIYFPLGERLFEIKRVEHEKPFYQLGSSYTYELSCELYEYENELIDTALEEVDNTVEDEGYITSLTLVGSTATATAAAVVSSGGVSEIFLNNDGSGYTSAPTVTFSAPESGLTATAVAITTSVGNVKSIKRIEITNSGIGYTVPPTITFSGGGGSGAAATCSVNTSNFNLTRIEITNPGDGYISPPNVTIGAPDGVGTTAIGIASLSSDGKLNAINIIKSGSGYTSSPPISVTGPSTIGVGTFIYNELITGESSGITGRVRDFRTTVSVTPGIPPVTHLRVSLNTGKFYTGEVIVGSISSARYVVENYDDESYDNPYDVNEEIQLEADGILDFTESNPFGNY
mgnify:FL=1|jgi:hypothetical protein|tara:strand:+ start:447 stop:1877 length:1431 start_codon:yes stop_codon:yes gene_type:complete